MAVTFPLYVTDVDLTAAELFSVQSFEAAESGELSEDNITFGDFLIWDANGFRVNATVEPRGPHWLKLTSTGIQDMQGLLEALSRYATAVGLGPEAIEGLGPGEALRTIEEREKQQLQEDRQKRRWYQFWRGG
jgi:hypothetical protein